MTRIEDKVMASVLLIHAGRRLVSATALKGYVVLTSFLALSYLVSFSAVFRNVSQVGVEGLLSFLGSAVIQTEITVQLALALGAVCAFLFARDLTRGPVLQGLA